MVGVVVEAAAGTVVAAERTERGEGAPPLPRPIGWGAERVLRGESLRGPMANEVELRYIWDTLQKMRSMLNFGELAYIVHII